VLVRTTGSRAAAAARIWAGLAVREQGERINTVQLSYVREGTGHALIGARQWIPEEHIKDPVKSLLTGLPLDQRFRTKGQLAIDICASCYADGLEFSFICGDEVYGGCTQLREFLEAAGQAYVLLVKLRDRAGRRDEADLRGGSETAGEGQAALGGPLRREGLQR
jgi:hypothetical protein